MTEHEEEERVTFLDESSCANLRSDVVAERLQDGSTANRKAMQKEMAAAAREAKKEAAKAQSSREKKEEQNARAAEKAGDAMRRKQELEEERYYAEEEAAEKQLALDKITMYRDKFKHLKKRNNVSAKSHLAEVLDEVHYIEMQLGQSDPSLGNPACLGLAAAMTGLESLTDHYNPMGLKLSGLGETTRTNMDKFEPLLDELMIKHGHNMVMSVEWRLAMVIGTVVLTVHAANCGVHFPSNIQAAASISNKEAKQDEAYADL